MRRRLVLLVGLTTLAVATSFAVPLWVLVGRTVAQDALDEARRDAAAVTPALALSGDSPTLVSTAAAATESGRDGRMGVAAPDGSNPLGASIEVMAARHDLDAALLEDALTLARHDARAFTLESSTGDRLVIAPVVTGTGVGVVVVIVTDALLTDGVAEIRAAMVLIALAVVLGAVLVADAMGRSVTVAMSDLASVAEAVAAGDLTRRARPGGTPDIASLGHEFNRLLDQVTALVASERESVADVAHRLRTPLTALRLDAEAVTEPGRRARLVETVDQLSSGVDAVIREARRSAEVDGTVDVAEVVSERCAFWRPLAEDEGRPLTVEAHAGRVRASRDALVELVDVLVGNVFAHTPAGTALSVSVDREDGFVMLVVADEGPGIADVVAALGRGASGAGSTGLGLDIAHRTALHLGGTLELMGEPGTTVTVRLPAA